MDWDEYLMGYAIHAAKKSKDETQVGAVLVAPNGKTVLLTGFNGPPAGVVDSADRFERPKKYLFVSHAEANIVSFAARHGIVTDGCSMYCTHSPCSRCACAMVQAGIKCVTVGDAVTKMPQEEFQAAVTILQEAGVELKGSPFSGL